MARILLIEDDDCVRHCVIQLLEIFGHSVIDVSNGSEALNLIYLHGIAFDLVLSDKNMPEMDGVRFTRIFKSLSSNTQVIIMTADRCTNCAADFIILKPWNMKELETIVNEALALRKAG